MKRFTLAAASLAALLLAAAPPQSHSQAAAAWTAPQRERAGALLRDLAGGHGRFDPPGLDRAAARNFRGAASYFTHLGEYPLVEVSAFDPVTRCVVSMTFNLDQSRQGGQGAAYSRASGISNGPSAADMALDSVAALRALGGNGGMVAAGECPAQLQQVYGSEFDSNRRRFEGLAQHSQAVLNGGAAGSEDAPLGLAEMQQTAISRGYARRMMRSPTFLVATTSADRALVVIGDRGGAVRWVSEYVNAGEGRWRFVGATDVGASLLLR